MPVPAKENLVFQIEIAVLLILAVIMIPDVVMMAVGKQENHALRGLMFAVME